MTTGKADDVAGGFLVEHEIGDIGHKHAKSAMVSLFEIGVVQRLFPGRNRFLRNRLRHTIDDFINRLISWFVA